MAIDNSNNLIIFDANHVDDATITGGPFYANFSGDQLKSDELTYPARSNGTSMAIKVTLDRPLTVNAVAVLAHTLSDGATWRIRCGNDAALVGSNPNSADVEYDSLAVFGTTTSNSSLTVQSGQVSLTVANNLSFYSGVGVRLENGSNYMQGDVVSYDDVTGELVIKVVEQGGSGTFASWTVTRYAGARSVWPEVEPFGKYRYGEFVWGGRLFTGARYNPPGIALMPTDLIRVQYVLIEVDDPNNSNAWLDIGRLFIGSMWQPQYNMSLGREIKWIDPSDKERTPGANVITQTREKFRVFRFELNYLSDDEAFNRAYELDRTHGTTRPLLVVLDPADKRNLHRNTIYGSLRELGANTHRHHNTNSRRYEFEEHV